MSYDDDEVTFKVVVNQRDQVSIWPADRAIPVGWSETGRTGSKSECLAEIEGLAESTRFKIPRARGRAHLAR